MKFFVGVTDNNWYRFLAERQPDEVNFWLPSSTQGFGALNPGELFLFKLHSPLNYIAGGGFFVSYSKLPISLAWDDFGEKNGAENYQTFFNLLSRHRTNGATINQNFDIGNIILAYPFFFKQNEWIPVPPDWKANIVRGKTYSSVNEPGASLFKKVLVKLRETGHISNGLAFYNDQRAEDPRHELPRFSEEFLTRSRLGQGSFSALIRDAYARQCAITGGKALPVLEAAHIKPVEHLGPNSPSNGILLRSDFHTLFDKGYLTITPEYDIEVSGRLKTEFRNGKEYYQYHGKKLVQLPPLHNMKPAREFLDWHNTTIFIA